MRILFYFIACLIFLFQEQTVWAQTEPLYSNKGKDFWLGYGHNVLFTADFPPNAQTMTVYLSAEKATTVTASVNGTSFSQTVNIPANTVDFSVVIPKFGANDARITQEGKFTRGVHIEASEPIVAYTHQYGTQSSAATMLFPQETYGYTYRSVNYDQNSNYGNSFSWMFVVAAENNTRVEVTPSDSTQGGLLPGQTITVDLMKGEGYNIFGKQTGTYTSKDLTGSKMTSVAGADGTCHPIAVYSGSSRIQICSGDGGEFMQQQIFPASAWGTTYLTYHTLNNTSNNVTTPYLNFYRVVVNDPATIVKRNGTPLTGLINNFYYQFSSTSGDFIEADEPILVAQYMPSSNQCTGTVNPPAGDPEMFILSPLQQGITSANFYNTRRQNIDNNYVDLIVHKDGLPSLRIDGAAPPAVGIIAHPNNSDYVFVAKRLLGAGAQHRITCDSSFVSKVYGMGQFESYGYLTGTLLNNLNGLINIENVYNNTNRVNTFTCPKSPFHLSVRLAYKANSILWQFSQSNGLNTKTDTLLNNPVPDDSVIISGRKYYTYRLPAAYFATDTGVFVIPVTASSPAVDHCDQKEYLKLQLQVKKAPVSDFTSTHSGCVSDSVAFTGTPNANGYVLDRYAWYFPGNMIDSGLSVKHKFAAGTHEVGFRVITQDGCLHDTTKSIMVNPGPVAGFASVAVACLGDAVSIKDTSSFPGGTITEWHWDFGDGSTDIKSSNAIFDHLYAAAGTYTVRLWVNSASGCKSDTSVHDIVISSPAVASFTSSGQHCADQPVTFTSTATPAASSITHWYWDLGNGQILNNSNANPVVMAYTFPGSGIMVKHAVVDAAGCKSDTVSGVPFNILPGPTASFTLLSDTLCALSDLLFNATGQVAAGNIAAYNWNFGDSKTDTGTLVRHQYNTAGNYTVSLYSVSDSSCSSDTVKTAIVIFPVPTVDAGPDYLVPLGNSVVFAPSNIANASYTWTPALYLDDPTKKSPVCVPLQAQLYRLLVVDQNGCSAKDSLQVNVVRDITIPNAFSPNGDGINDLWVIYGLEDYPAARSVLFDRYGHEIMQFPGYKNPWDGTIRGNPVPAGVYYYIIDLKNGTAPFTGSLTILR